MSDTGATCVILAERHGGLTEGLRGLLETTFSAVLMVADEASLIEGVDRVRPDVVIGDLALARKGRLHWVRELRRRWPEIKLIVISVHDEDGARQACLEAGADEFVLKRAIATDLLQVVERVWPGPGQDPRPSLSGPAAA